MVEDGGDDGDDLDYGFELAEVAGLDGEAFAGGDGAETADEELAADDEDGDPGLHDVGVVGDQQDEGGGDHELVGEGVEEHAEGGDLAAAAGEEAVEAVGDRGEDEDGGGDEFLLAVGAVPGEARGEGPDQQGDACDAGQRYGVGQIHGMGSGAMRSREYCHSPIKQEVGSRKGSSGIRGAEDPVEKQISEGNDRKKGNGKGRSRSFAASRDNLMSDETKRPR